jgi:hypothetical protein
VSTRLIGAPDHDPLRRRRLVCPPRLAPAHVVILPVRNIPEDLPDGGPDRSNMRCIFTGAPADKVALFAKSY